MKVIGHRGCAEQYPENTLHAVTRAARYLETVEVDVRRCASGEPVVFHDETVDRVTDGTGRVADLTLAELRALDVLGSGERVPLLSAVLAALPDGVTVQLELKETGLAEDALRAGESSVNDVVVSSFIPDALAEVSAHDPAIPTGFLFEEDPHANTEHAIDLDCEFVHPHYDLCLETDVVDRAHARGLGVIAWKAARTREEVEALREVGVDGVTADRWDIA